MPHYEWQRGEPFRDHANDRTVSEGDVVELAEGLAADHAAFVKVEEPDGPDATPGDDGGETGSQSAESDGTDYAAMDYSELRQLAVDADTDEINGRSSKDDIVAYLSEE